jgi:hypothetical protein
MGQIFYGILIFFIVIPLGLIFLNYYLGQKRNEKLEERKQLLLEKIKQLPFNLFKKSSFYVHSKIYAAGIDKDKRKIIICDENLRYSSYPFDKIIDIKVNVDGETVINSSTMKTIGRSLVGGVLAGGAGAIIGGLSGSKIATNRVKLLELEFLFNDIENPSIKVIFYDRNSTITVEREAILKKAKLDIDDWLNFFKVIQYQQKHNAIK